MRCKGQGQEKTGEVGQRQLLSSGRKFKVNVTGPVLTLVMIWCRSACNVLICSFKALSRAAALSYLDPRFYFHARSFDLRLSKCVRGYKKNRKLVAPSSPTAAQFRVPSLQARCSIRFRAPWPRRAKREKGWKKKRSAESFGTIRGLLTNRKLPTKKTKAIFRPRTYRLKARP